MKSTIKTAAKFTEGLNHSADDNETIKQVIQHIQAI
jgi:hypothetical protein